MSRGRAFYYVESAPQIISAYRHYRQTEASGFDMIIRLNGNLHNDDQIHQVLNELDISKLGDVICTSIGFGLIVALIRKALLRNYETFCVADIRSLIGLVAIIISRCKHIVLLDDGIASITYYQRRIEGREIVSGGLIKRAVARCAAKRLKSITLHTMLPLSPADCMTIEVNVYKFQSVNDRKIGVDHEFVLFIGSKVVEAGVCSSEFFDCVMRRFSNEHRGRRKVYVAHRDENLEKMAKFPEIEAIRLLRPIELEYGVRSDMPGVICGFYSAGLVNFLPYRNQVKIATYGLPIETTNQRFHESISASRYLFEYILCIDSV